LAPQKQEKRMKINLATLPQDEMDKVNIDLAAAGVAFKERYNMPVIAEVVEREQPAHLRDWFRERLIAHRLASVTLSRLPYEPKVK
jgi:DNA polymerase III, theta subunit.